MVSLVSCNEPIKLEDKICLLAKIIERTTYTKGGTKVYAYVYKGKTYLDFSSFDNRILGIGDMFLIFVNKKNPYINEIVNPRSKIILLDDSISIKKNNCNIDSLDLNILQEI
jgi:hypothetical protein